MKGFCCRRRFVWAREWRNLETCRNHWNNVISCIHRFLRWQLPLLQSLSSPRYVYLLMESSRRKKKSEFLCSFYQRAQLAYNFFPYGQRFNVVSILEERKKQKKSFFALTFWCAVCVFLQMFVFSQVSLTLFSPSGSAAGGKRDWSLVTMLFVSYSGLQKNNRAIGKRWNPSKLCIFVHHRNPGLPFFCLFFCRKKVLFVKQRGRRKRETEKKNTV